MRKNSALLAKPLSLIVFSTRLFRAGGITKLIIGIFVYVTLIPYSVSNGRSVGQVNLAYSSPAWRLFWALSFFLWGGSSRVARTTFGMCRRRRGWSLVCQTH